LGSVPWREGADMRVVFEGDRHELNGLCRRDLGIALAAHFTYTHGCCTRLYKQYNHFDILLFFGD